MNTHLFSAGLTSTQVRPLPAGQAQAANRPATWESCVSLIVRADDPGQAHALFEESVGVRPVDGIENPIHVVIDKLVTAQFLDQLLAESGASAIDWTKSQQQANALIESTPADDFEQGYWVDVNEFLPVMDAAADVEALQRDLPEDVRSGLNWSPEKKFFFIISVLRPPPLPASHAGFEADDAESGNSEEPQEEILDESLAELPQLAEKEAAALVEARNSVIAAWLWRKFAADTPHASNKILIDPWCNVIEPKPAGE